MAHLHELLAVDRDVENIANKVVDEAVVTFTKKPEHFLGNNRRLEMFSEDRKQEEEAFNEVKEIVTTVQKKLDYVGDALIRHIDVITQKEFTNQEAVADIVLPDGTVIAKDLPATLLLTLEGKLAKWRVLYDAIPTLQPGVRWVPDSDKGEGIYRAENDEKKHKTEKVQLSRIVAPATDKHPAQVRDWTEDRPIGQYINTRWSSMITPAKKSELLGKIDTLLAAVKQARMRANTTEVKKVNLGKSLIDFINS